MKPDLAPYQQAAGNLASEGAETRSDHDLIRGLVIASDDDQEFAAGLLREVKARYALLEERRKSVTAPLRAVVDEINSWFKPVTEQLQASEREIKAKLAAYLRACEAANRAALQAAAAAPTAQAATTALATVTPARPPAGVSVRKVWRYEIVDEDAVPRALCSPDAHKLGALLSGHVADHGRPPDVPGVRFYQDEQVAARTR